MLGKQGFNEWAAEYDDTVRESERQGTYPFAGYSDVLTEIFEAVDEKQQASLLYTTKGIVFSGLIFHLK
ncbi:hypothetical protein ON064_11800 [Planococcus sp. A6]|uniref:hypothetical protein n=1 Tax=Planococcus sp. A6 TaxID=2992760 RepID=UPI00237A8B3F|nr:hypothetical protein [Planococcus sp. A6]MDE0583715.1 hypothetical protein [Planococcus sp. A6]